MIQSLITLLLAVTTLHVTPQKLQQKPVPLEKRFDFWVGKWNASWTNPDGTKGKATNEITRTLGGKVIKEDFQVKDDPKIKGYIGWSFSVYNPASKTWKQTWVDNQGGYLDFTGSFDGNKRIFERSFLGTKGKFKGKKIKQRMVFYNIRHESFDWDWESSLDGGKTWKKNWQIKYTRVK